MNRMFLIGGFFFLALPTSASAKLSLKFPVSCDFQFGQYMDSQKAETDVQKSVLEWNFFELMGAKPTFLSGGDSGSLTVYRQKTSDGVSMLLKQGNGAHLFSIWPDGTAFWSKHNDLGGQKATQQFRGTCQNIQKKDY